MAGIRNIPQAIASQRILASKTHLSCLTKFVIPCLVMAMLNAPTTSFGQTEGVWSPPFPSVPPADAGNPIRAIHAALTHTGHVIYWQESRNEARLVGAWPWQGPDDNTQITTFLVPPVHQLWLGVFNANLTECSDGYDPNSVTDIYCSGHSFDENGKLDR